MSELHCPSSMEVSHDQPIQVEVVEETSPLENMTPLIVHELKNPLTSIRGYTELLLSGATGPISSEQRKFLLTILSNVQRMSLLVADLSDSQKIESGHLELKIETTDFCAILEEVSQSAQPLLEEKKLQLAIHLSGKPLPIRADEQRMSQILTNLLSNAIKYTPEGGHIEIQAEKELQPAGGRLHIQVKDSGIGISKESQKKMFQKYYRAPDDLTRDVPGTGLGLYIAKLLLNLQHGEIWVESEINKGSTFHFTIPLAEEPA